MIFARIVCILIDHRPAIVYRTPCRCTRCGAMIAWDNKGGWRYA